MTVSMGRRSLVAATATALLALSGCDAVESGPDHYTVLLRQTTYGVAWQLDAWSNGQDFCMTIDSPKGPQDHSFAWAAGGCGFDEKFKGSGYWIAGALPGTKDSTNEFVSFGPLPEDAQKIRVATRTAIATHVLPNGPGVPSGRFWYVVGYKSWPGPFGGTVLDTPQPLNEAGAPVSFAPF
jgi:hypothetical protein